MLPSISHVETTATRNYEISIEVPLVRLRALGLSLDGIANAVRRSSLDLSAGNIDTRAAEVRIRTLRQKYHQPDFEEIVVIDREDRTVMRLGDIVAVRDAFQDSSLVIRHQGRPAVFVEVFLVEGEQVMDVAEAIHEHIARVHTDELTVYASMPEYEHKAVIHSAGDHVRRRVHANRTESFWVPFKRGYYGTSVT